MSPKNSLSSVFETVLPETVFSPLREQSVMLHARYDWTTSVPDNGNVWRKYRVAPRAYPSHPLVCAYFHRVGNKERFRLPGARGEHFHCTVDPSPGHIRCRDAFCTETLNFRGRFRGMYTPVCIFVSTLAREFVGQISRFACSVLFGGV